MMLKVPQPTMSAAEIYQTISQQYGFAHDTRNKSTIYKIDKATHVAEPFSPDRSDNLYHRTMVAISQTQDPVTGMLYATPSGSKILSAFSFGMVEAEGRGIVPAARSYRRDGDVWLDLGKDDGTALHISAGRVEIGRVPDGLIWLRDESCAAIDVPADILDTPSKTLLGACMRMWGQDADVVAQLLSAAAHRILHPTDAGSQQPIILIEGPAGAGKTVLSLMYQDLVDPKTSREEVAAGTLDPESVRMSASRMSVLVLGNATRITQVLSDLLCVIATKGSETARKLYSQTDVVRWYLIAQIVLTGISLGRLNGDLVTRLLHVTLSPRSSDATMTDAGLWTAWDHILPTLRAALWRLCADVLQSEQDNCISLAGMPGRLRDFETTMRRVDRILGTHAERSWLDMLDDDQQLQQSDDPIVMAIIDRWDAIRDRTLTCEELFDLLAPAFDRINVGDAGTQRLSPRSPRALAQNMNRVLPALQALRIQIMQNKDAHRKVKTWRLSLPEGVALPDSPIRQSVRRSPFAGMDYAA